MTTNEKNAETSHVEVQHFIDNIPLKYFAYITKSMPDKLTTWMGDVLGDIRFGHEYNCPSFGRNSRRISVRVKGINGAWYSGTYFKSAGDYVRLTRTKRIGW